MSRALAHLRPRPGWALGSIELLHRAAVVRALSLELKLDCRRGAPRRPHPHAHLPFVVHRSRFPGSAATGAANQLQPWRLTSNRSGQSVANTKAYVPRWPCRSIRLWGGSRRLANSPSGRRLAESSRRCEYGHNATVSAVAFAEPGEPGWWVYCQLSRKSLGGLSSRAVLR